MTERAVGDEPGPSGPSGMGARVVAKLPSLRSRNFRRYLLGQAFSLGGTNLQAIAVAWLVVDTHGEGRALGLVLACQFLPAVLVGPNAGAVADRFDPRRVVLGLQVLLGLQSATLATMVFTGHTSLPVLCSLAVVQGVGGAFDWPVRQSMVALTVPLADLSNAVATASMVAQTGSILGPAFGALLIPTLGVGWCLALNAASYVGLFFAVLSMRASEFNPRTNTTTVRGSTVAGVRYVRRRRDLQLQLMVVGLAGLVAHRIDVVFPVLARNELHGGSVLYSLLVFGRGVGTVIATALIAVRRSVPQLQLQRWSCLGIAAAWLILTIHAAPVAVLGTVVIGFAMSGAGITNLTLIQSWCAPEYRGRVLGFWYTSMNLSIVLGSLLTGALVDHFGTAPTIVVGSLTMVVVWWSTGSGRGDRLPDPLPDPA